MVGTNKGEVSLAWQAPKDASNAPVENYIIEIATGDSANFAEFGRVKGQNFTFDASGLKDGQKYNFRVRAQNVVGTSAGGAQLDKPVIASAIGKNLLIDTHCLVCCVVCFLVNWCVSKSKKCSQCEKMVCTILYLTYILQSSFL